MRSGILFFPGNISLTPVKPLNIYGFEVKDPVNLSITSKDLNKAEASHEIKMDAKIAGF